MIYASNQKDALLAGASDEYRDNQSFLKKRLYSACTSVYASNEEVALLAVASNDCH